MKHIEYLDLPKVPESIIQPTKAILQKQSTHPYAKPINSDLNDWLNNMFGREITACYQIIGEILPGLAPHKDRNGRIRGYNYIIQTGGNNVYTTTYDQSMNIVDEVVLEPNRWHRLDTGEWHSVHGIGVNDIRIAITVTYPEDILAPPINYPLGFNTKEWYASKFSEL